MLLIFNQKQEVVMPYNVFASNNKIDKYVMLQNFWAEEFFESKADPR